MLCDSIFFVHSRYGKLGHHVMYLCIVTPHVSCKAWFGRKCDTGYITLGYLFLFSLLFTSIFRLSNSKYFF